MAASATTGADTRTDRLRIQRNPVTMRAFERILRIKRMNRLIVWALTALMLIVGALLLHGRLRLQS